MRNRNLFHSASLRLSGLYLLTIMVLSLLFSVNSYVQFANETDQSASRPLPQIIRRLPTEDIESVFLERAEFARVTKNDYKNSLFLINILILLGGGLLSYTLARRTLRPIEEAHEAQSRFTADASHELRTPITAMRAETELTLTEPKLTLKEAKKQLESNIEELDKLTALSEGLLQLARLDNNGLEKESVSVENIVQQSVERVHKKSKQKKQIITMKDITKTEVIVNQPAVIEALVTILDNAIKYSPEKSKILIASNLQLGLAKITISDKGPGIQASELPYIFDRFYRADSSRTNSGEHGYGIGLSIAKSVAEAHHGTVSAKSTLGKGSTFTLSLPTK